MTFECGFYSFYVPDKDSGVPEKVTAADKYLCQFQTALYGKGFYFMKVVIQLFFGVLYISVAFIGPHWADTMGKVNLMARAGIHTLRADSRNTFFSSVKRL